MYSHNKYFLLYILIAIIYIIIDIIIANTFKEIARDKGYKSEVSRFFWWTFFIPPIGIAMVIALPDLKTRDMVTQSITNLQELLSNKEHPIDTKTKTNTITQNKDNSTNGWVCANCYFMNPITNTSCQRCGHSQSDK